MNKLFIHVGPHKTGTTSIQKFLLDNRVLLFKDNLVYPKRHSTIFGHHGYRQLIQDKTLDKEEVEFFNEPHDFLLSSEDFISLNKADFEYLRETITSKQIVILFAWRRASFKLYSIWQETIKHGGTDTFYAYYHDHLARPGQSQMLSPDLKLNMFSQVFGKDNIRIIDYDAAAKQDDLLPVFCSTMERKWRGDFVTPEKNVNALNRSMDIADIEVIRALNHLFKSHWGITGADVRVAYKEQHNLLLENGLERLKAVIGQHETQLTVGNYFIDNRAEKLMNERYRDQIVNYQPLSETKSLKLVNPDWMFEKEAHAILEGLAGTLKSKLETGN